MRRLNLTAMLEGLNRAVVVRQISNAPVAAMKRPLAANSSHHQHALQSEVDPNVWTANGGQSWYGRAARESPSGTRRGPLPIRGVDAPTTRQRFLARDFLTFFVSRSRFA